MNEKVLKDYRIVSDHKIKPFQEAVLALANEGFELFGPPFDSDGFLCQAMIKLEYDHARGAI